VLAREQRVVRSNLICVSSFPTFVRLLPLMSNSCEHRFSQVTRHPTRGSAIASGTCTHCGSRLCLHDLLDGRQIAGAITYRFTHPLSSSAVSGCLICQGSPRSNTFEERRLHPWFDDEGPTLPAAWTFAGNANASSEEAPAVAP